MVDGAKIKIRKKDQLLAKLNGLAPTVEKELVAANRRSADDMVAYARSFAPVRTGALRDSIVVTPPGSKVPGYGQGAKLVPPGAFAVTVGNSAVRYPHLPEYGTAPHINAGLFPGTQHLGTARQPYFWPAYRLIRKVLRGRAGRALGKALKKAMS